MEEPSAHPVHKRARGRRPSDSSRGSRSQDVSAEGPSTTAITIEGRTKAVTSKAQGAANDDFPLSVIPPADTTTTADSSLQQGEKRSSGRKRTLPRRLLLGGVYESDGSEEHAPPVPAKTAKGAASEGTKRKRQRNDADTAGKEPIPPPGSSGADTTTVGRKRRAATVTTSERSPAVKRARPMQSTPTAAIAELEGAAGTELPTTTSRRRKSGSAVRTPASKSSTPSKPRGKTPPPTNSAERDAAQISMRSTFDTLAAGAVEAIPFNNMKTFNPCSHLQAVDVNKISKHAFTHPNRWKCGICETSEDLWVCCSCGHIGCGREVNGHAMKHFSDMNGDGIKTGPSTLCEHGIAFNLREGTAFCYACDDWAVSDRGEQLEGMQIRLRLIIRGIVPSAEIVAHIMHKVKEVAATGATQKHVDAAQEAIDEIVARRAAKQDFHTVPGFSEHDAALQQQEDNEASALSMNRTRLLKKTFLAWTECTRLTRAEKAAAAVVSVPTKAVTPRAQPAKRIGLIPGRTGMRNMGNTCYIASTMQALSHVTVFREHFRTFQFFGYPSDVFLTPLSPRKLTFSQAEGFSSQLPEKSQSISSTATNLIPVFTPVLTAANPNDSVIPSLGGISQSVNTAGDASVSSVFALPASMRLIRQSTHSAYDAMTNARKDGKVVIKDTVAVVVPDQTEPSATDDAPTVSSAEKASLSLAGGSNPHHNVAKWPRGRGAAKRGPQKIAGNPWADSLVMQTSGTIKLLWSGRWSVFTPAGLIYSVWRNFPQFQSFAQQDAQEFFNAFLDTLHEELRRGGVPKGIPTASAYLMSAASPAKPLPSLALPSATTAGDSSLSALGSPSTVIGAAVSSLDTPSKPRSILQSISGLRKPSIAEPIDPTSPKDDIVTLMNLPKAVRLSNEVQRTGVGHVGVDALPSVNSLPRFPQSNFIADSFQGSTATLVTCNECGTVSRKSEIFWCLSLDIDVAKPTLQQCFQKLCTPEELRGDSAYLCEPCGLKRAATKSTQIEKLPTVLAMHLNRAQWSSRGRTEKIQLAVKFPLFFHRSHLSTFLTPEAVAAAAADADEETQQYYRLQAVVVHQGRGIHTGHYTAYCYDTDHNTWLWYDDHKVTPALWGQVQRAQAYLLVYELVSREGISAEAVTYEGTDAEMLLSNVAAPT